MLTTAKVNDFGSIFLLISVFFLFRVLLPTEKYKLSHACLNTFNIVKVQPSVISMVFLVS